MALCQGQSGTQYSMSKRFMVTDLELGQTWKMARSPTAFQAIALSFILMLNFDDSESITDKRISRRHAILEVVDDQLRIKPTHINPCFHQSSEKSQLLPLETNKWHWLNPGDSFSLLVDKYTFRVFSTHSEMECTLRNSQMLDEDELFDESPTSPPFSAKYRNSSEQPNSVQRKRILPAWMIQGDLNVQTLEMPFTQEDNGVTKEKSHMYPTSSKGRKRLSSSEKSENIEAEQDPKRRYKADDQEDSTSSSKEANGSSDVVGVRKREMINTKAKSERSEIPGDQRDENLDDENCEQRIYPRSKINKTDENKKDVSMEYSEDPKSDEDKLFQKKTQGLDPEQSSDPEASSSTKSIAVPQGFGGNHPRRTPCFYGASCYRKNPIHFQQFSHPSDGDYGDTQVMNQDEDDNRPECSYGASCYRKNPQHKIEYKHSKPSEMKIKRSRHKANKKGTSVSDDSDNDGQPNEYDLNDSFLDDDEEEYEPTDEDSDWEPANEDQEVLDKESWFHCSHVKKIPRVVVEEERDPEEEDGEIAERLSSGNMSAVKKIEKEDNGSDGEDNG
ncbi:aprataxin and PNK-like factor [Gracilinanus agilis]|uniref:aprataxin and PNK-like factor n=1 Tax=Gracilinanus agilis TaxID=191870 RepID=UPI001CFE31AA|nr:aprataxin and PNK-like factor [Gracilinanus agilis]